MASSLVDTVREVLPIPDRKPVSLTTYDAKDPDTRFPPIRPLRPPAGAPNVLVILLDDVGFGASSAFGGPCQTPNAERLAKGGLKYIRFHTTALCSPTRAAMLSGRNHHAVGMGGITEIATSAPGYNSLRPNTCAPLAEILKLNGYSTAQFGKCHEVPVFETTPIGPFDHWPTGSGFEHFYGFIGGENNQYHPALYDGTTPIEPERTPEEGYHLTEDLADRAIAWIRQQKAVAPDKPFFVYFATGACHAPHHVPKDWIAKYTGKFDQGWDKVREETFARQKKLGVIPSDCELTARPKEIPSWGETEERLRPVLARQMEIYAAFLEHADHHAGRVIDSLTDLGILGDTLIYYIVGDNGASAEGSLIGAFNDKTGGEAPDLSTADLLIQHIDDVFPLDDRKAERTNPDISGRPQVVRGNTQLFFPGMRRLSENSVINIKNKSHSVTADIDVPEAGATGVIAAHGGNFGGWSLYAHEGRLRYFYNFLGLLHFDVTSAGKLPAGPHQVRMEFTYDGGGLGKGGTSKLYVDGKPAGEGRISRTHAFFFSMDETMEIGCDVGEPVSPDYGPRGNAFSGTVKWVQIDIDAAAKDADHMIGAEERFKLALARQ
jgi:arylsulfatase A-like enzyme